MKKRSKVTPDIITYVRLLLVTFLVTVFAVASLISWQINQNDKIHDLETNYHTASTFHFDTIRYEILKIKSMHDHKINHTHHDDQILKSQDIYQSLHIIHQSFEEIITVQKKYKFEKFDNLIYRLQQQLKPLSSILEDMSSENKKVQADDIDALLLTANQLERLHKISHKSLVQLSRETEKQHINIMFGFVLSIILLSSFITRKIYTSIIDILRNQRKSENNLRIEKELIHTTLNSIDDAVITIDELGTIQTFNMTAEKLFGSKSNEVIGTNINQFMPEPVASEHDSYLQRYIGTGEPHVIGLNREVLAMRKNKETFPMSLSLAELPVGADGKRHFLGSCQDLTNIKQKEEQIRRSQKMDALGKLTGGIAHDYNNMLGVVSGYAELLKNNLQDQPKLLKYANEIHHAGQRGALLTQKLLSFSSQKSTAEKALNLNQLLLNQQNMLEKTLTARISMTFDLQEDLWPIWVDHSDIEDAILNMSINAMHAIQGNGQLVFRTHNQNINTFDATNLGLAANDYVILSISDTGCGMDTATKEKIFDPFFTTKGDKGTGLGLSQLYGFMDRSKGGIKVYSEPDHGTRFNLYFPRYIERDCNVQQDQEEVITNDKGHETILLVDDEPSLLDLTSEILRLQGYKVLTAGSAAQALRILEQENIDLLLTDVIMPEMDGYQLVAKVKSKYPSVKIQLASGFADITNSGMIDHKLNQNMLNKPYNSQTLVKCIRKLLDSVDE